MAAPEGYWRGSVQFMPEPHIVRFVMRPLGTGANWRADIRVRGSGRSLSTELGPVNIDTNAETPQAAVDAFRRFMEQHGVQLTEDNYKVCMLALGPNFG